MQEIETSTNRKENVPNDPTSKGKENIDEDVSDDSMKIPAKYLPINDNEEEVTTDITGIDRLIISMESADDSDDAKASEACEGGDVVLNLMNPFLVSRTVFSLLKGIFVFVFCFLSCLLLTLLSFSLFPGISEDLPAGGW